MTSRSLCVALLASALATTVYAADTKAVPYTWKSVQMVGGGFVDGIIFHPKAKGVRYARTDMGGAYRWNDTARRWEPILDWVGYKDLNLMGVESIAVDPGDDNRVYLACGTYTNPTTPDGAILVSSDRGKTFQRVNVPIKFGGNESGRGNGERLRVDPNDGRVIYLATRHAGLWRSTDRGATWARVESFTETNEDFKRSAPWDGPSGLVFVIYDPASGKPGSPSQTIYVGAAYMGRPSLFRSTDSGKTWTAVPGQPTRYRPLRAALAGDGTLYIAYGDTAGPAHMKTGGVWKFDMKSGAWTDITPDKPSEGREFGYVGVSVDAKNPKAVIASAFHYPKGDEIFRSTDGGATWKTVFTGDVKGTYDYTLAPYVARTPIHWLFDIEIDPFDSNHAIFTTGYGGYETFNLSEVDAGRSSKWSVMSTGIEETVALELLSPSEGAHVLTAVGDYGGFVHWDLDKPEPAGNYMNPHFGNTNAIANAAKAPLLIVRAGNGAGQNETTLGYTLDGGKTWTTATKLPVPAARLGHLAVSADGSTWLWTIDRGGSYITGDRASTWTECRGLPRNTRVIADPANPAKFYAMALFDGKLFLSTDRGATFATQDLTLPGGLPKRAGFGSNNGTSRGDDRGGQDRLYAAPGREGDLWLAAFDGLYRSIDSGAAFTKLNGITELHAFGFGKAAPKASYPALYMVGVVNGVRGIFRSTDTGANWVRINDDRHQWGLILHITGDPKQYGRVYVGTHGRGTLYGDPLTPEN